MLLIERTLVEASLLEKETTGLPEGVLLRVTYPVCNIGGRNHNGRVYERAVWERVHEDQDIKEKLSTKTLFGHAEHPETVKSSVEKVSHVITKSWIDETQTQPRLKQTFEVFDTPYGRIVNTLLRAGCGLGVSTRAEGELVEAEDDQGKFMRVVPDKYRYVTTDFTADPSTFGALPEKVELSLVPVLKQGLESRKVDPVWARRLLEVMTSKEAVVLLESIKEDAKVTTPATVVPPVASTVVPPVPVVPAKVVESIQDSDLDDLTKRLEAIFAGTDEPKKTKLTAALTERIASVSPLAKTLRDTQIALAEAKAELEVLHEVDEEREITLGKASAAYALEKTSLAKAKIAFKAEKLAFGESLAAAAKKKMDEKVTAVKQAAALAVREAVDKVTKTFEAKIKVLESASKQTQIKQYVKGVLEHSKLAVPPKARALLEACGTEQEVLDKVAELRDEIAEAALHLGAVKETEPKPVATQADAVETAVRTVAAHMF